MAASYGLLPEGEETTALQAAEALINKLVPAQRSPGSGPMSDRDVALYKSSLPSLWNSPGGNVILLDTMEALANYKAQQAEVAMAVSNRIMTPQEGVKSLMALPDPLAAFKEWKKTQGKGGGSPGTGGDLKSKYGLE
jgi:flagellar protein FlgJ